MIELLFLMPELKIISYSEFLSRYFFLNICDHKEPQNILYGWKSAVDVCVFQLSFIIIYFILYII